MAKVVDISKYICNDQPEIVIFGKTYKVKSDKKTILIFNEMQKREAEKQKEIISGKKKAKDSEEEESADDRMMKLLLGDEAGKEVIELMEGMENYSTNARAITLNVMALATGQSYEDLEARFQKQQRGQ